MHTGRQNALVAHGSTSVRTGHRLCRFHVDAERRELRRRSWPSRDACSVVFPTVLTTSKPGKWELRLSQFRRCLETRFSFGLLLSEEFLISAECAPPGPGRPGPARNRTLTRVGLLLSTRLGLCRAGATGTAHVGLVVKPKLVRTPLHAVGVDGQLERQGRVELPLMWRRHSALSN